MYNDRNNTLKQFQDDYKVGVLSKDQINRSIHIPGLESCRNES